MKLTYIFLGCIIILTGCLDNPRINKPKDLIDTEEMSQLISELLITKTISSLNDTKDSLFNFVTDSDDFLYLTHGVDSGRFARSVRYYEGYPNKMVEILEQSKKILTSLHPDSTTNITSDTTGLCVQLLPSK